MGLPTLLQSTGCQGSEEYGMFLWYSQQDLALGSLEGWSSRVFLQTDQTQAILAAASVC